MSFVSSSLLLNLVETDNLFRPIILDGVKGSGPLCDYSTTMTLTRSTTYKQSSMQISTAIIPNYIDYFSPCMSPFAFIPFASRFEAPTAHPHPGVRAFSFRAQNNGRSRFPAFICYLPWAVSQPDGTDTSQTPDIDHLRSRSVRFLLSPSSPADAAISSHLIRPETERSRT